MFAPFFFGMISVTTNFAATAGAAFVVFKNSLIGISPENPFFTKSGRGSVLFTRIFCSARMKGEKMQQSSIRKTHLAHGIEKTEYEARYDENVKALLSDKQVLARIAKYRTEEFKDYDIPTIMECIEGTPEISKVSVYPGKAMMDAITGMNTESKESKEGEVTFDVRFYMVTKDQERIKIILNIEAQKEYYLKYHFEPRSVFYCARMLSEQLDREFTADNYDELKKVYSIWIFFEAPERDSDTITEYHLAKKDVYGIPVKGWKYDYISISFIRLSSGKKQNSKNKLINMLDTLFSNTIDVESKKRLLEEDHQMQMTRELEGGIDSMCNVSLGIREKALAEGIEQGIKAMILTCQEFGVSKDEVLSKILKNSSVAVEVAKELVDKYYHNSN